MNCWHCDRPAHGVCLSQEDPVELPNIDKRDG
jgi:hypothetical protein